MEILLLTHHPDGAAGVLPALTLLRHTVRVVPMEPAALLGAPEAALVLLDASDDLAGARATCGLLHVTGLALPLVIVVTEGGLAAVDTTWGAQDVVLTHASPAELDARIRLAHDAARARAAEERPEEIAQGELVIDTSAYAVRLRGRPLDLTYKEFELLKCLVQHPGRVFTRAQLLHEVWGYDYYGGTRTVDVHIRRLRAKLGAEYDQLISTVRNVGYRFDSPRERRAARESLAISEGAASGAGVKVTER